TDSPQAAHLIRQPTVRVSSFNHHQPAVMAITKWSIQTRRQKKPRLLEGGAAARPVRASHSTSQPSVVSATQWEGALGASLKAAPHIAAPLLPRALAPSL